jgi:hypothetical protein
MVELVPTFLFVRIKCQCCISLLDYNDFNMMTSSSPGRDEKAAHICYINLVM